MFVSFAHFMDASQGFSNGILRAVGAQLYGFVMNMVSFYLIGLPIGIFLMFKTDLGVMGKLNDLTSFSTVYSNLIKRILDRVLCSSWTLASTTGAIYK